MKQTSSKHQADIIQTVITFQTYLINMCTTCALIALCLLDVCFIV